MANKANNINEKKDKNRLISLAKNNTDTINRIVRINASQITDNSLENNFFRGTNFNDYGSLENLLLPSGYF